MKPVAFGLYLQAAFETPTLDAESGLLHVMLETGHLIKMILEGGGKDPPYKGLSSLEHEVLLTFFVDALATGYGYRFFAPLLMRVNRDLAGRSKLGPLRERESSIAHFVVTALLVRSGESANFDSYLSEYRSGYLHPSVVRWIAGTSRKDGSAASSTRKLLKRHSRTDEKS